MKFLCIIYYLIYGLYIIIFVKLISEDGRFCLIAITTNLLIFDFTEETRIP